MRVPKSQQGADPDDDLGGGYAASLHVNAAEVAAGTPITSPPQQQLPLHAQSPVTAQPGYSLGLSFTGSAKGHGVVLQQHHHQHIATPVTYSHFQSQHSTGGAASTTSSHATPATSTSAARRAAPPSSSSSTNAAASSMSAVAYARSTLAWNMSADTRTHSTPHSSPQVNLAVSPPTPSTGTPHSTRSSPQPAAATSTAPRSPAAAAAAAAGDAELDWGAWIARINELPEDSVAAATAKFRALTTLARDFAAFAEMYGKVIISELPLPVGAKTIRPDKHMGGRAGGEKYVVRNVIFKLALDGSNIYTSDEFATKAAGHDLKGARSLAYASVADLHFPLQCLVDYLGFRVVAVTRVPIRPQTPPAYGSSDGGHTVHNSNATLNERMKEAAARLNLAEHVAGLPGPGTVPQRLHHAVDVEAHVGRDNRFYILDTARVFPAEHPDETPHLPHIRGQRSIFFRLLRSDFVRSWQEPLSADALSRFSTADPDAHAHGERVRRATRQLVRVVVPRTAAELAQSFQDAQSSSDKSAISVTDELHRRGVNLRHMGLVRSHLPRMSAGGEEAALALLVEMVARSLKQVLRTMLRETVLRRPDHQQQHKPLSASGRAGASGGAGAGAGAGAGGGARATAATPAAVQVARSSSSGSSSSMNPYSRQDTPATRAQVAGAMSAKASGLRESLPSPSSDSPAPDNAMMRRSNSLLQVMQRSASQEHLGGGTHKPGVAHGTPAGYLARAVELTLEFLNLATGATASSASASATTAASPASSSSAGAAAGAASPAGHAAAQLDEFWRVDVTHAVQARFGKVACTAEEVAALASSRRPLGAIVTRLCSMVGVRLSAAAASQARADPCGFLFVRSDVEGMEALVRTASRDSYARGTLLTLEGMAAASKNDHRAAIRLFDRALDNYRHSLHDGPNNPTILSKFGHSLRQKSMSLMASNQRSAARDTGKQARRVFDMIETPAQLLDSDKGIGEKRAILGQPGEDSPALKRRRMQSTNSAPPPAGYTLGAHDPFSAPQDATSAPIHGGAHTLLSGLRVVGNGGGGMAAAGAPASASFTGLAAGGGGGGGRGGGGAGGGRGRPRSGSVDAPPKGVVRGPFDDAIVPPAAHHGNGNGRVHVGASPPGSSAGSIDMMLFSSSTSDSAAGEHHHHHHHGHGLSPGGGSSSSLHPQAGQSALVASTVPPIVVPTRSTSTPTTQQAQPQRASRKRRMVHDSAAAAAASGSPIRLPQQRGPAKLRFQQLGRAPVGATPVCCTPLVVPGSSPSAGGGAGGGAGAGGVDGSQPCVLAGSVAGRWVRVAHTSAQAAADAVTSGSTSPAAASLTVNEYVCLPHRLKAVTAAVACGKGRMAMATGAHVSVWSVPGVATSRDGGSTTAPAAAAAASSKQAGGGLKRSLSEGHAGAVEMRCLDHCKLLHDGASEVLPHGLCFIAKWSTLACCTRGGLVFLVRAEGDKLRVAVVLDTAAPEITACTAAVNSFYTGHADGTVHKWGLKSASTSGGSAGNLFETNFAGSGSQDARGAVGGGLQCMPRGVLHTGHRSSSSSAGGRHRGGGGAASASSSSGGTSRQHRVRPVGFLWWCGRHRVLLASTGGRICVFNIRGRPLASIGNAETAASTVTSLCVDDASGTIFVGLATGMLQAFSAAADLLWQGSSGSSPVTCLALGAPVLYAGTKDGWLRMWKHGS